MNWNLLNSSDQLNLIDTISETVNVLILKHSTRCSISIAALGRIERKWVDEIDSKTLKPYYLDLLNYRTVSNLIASHYNIEHQSPQILIIKKGKCIYSKTHMNITYENILSLIE